MKRKAINVLQWHITLISIVILVFSFLCWFGFIKHIASLAVGNTNEEDVEIEVASEPVAVNTENYGAVATPNGISVSKYIGLVDKIVDKFDASWYSNMFMKSQISKADSVYTYLTTHDVLSSQVVVGSEDWLFYKSSINNEPYGFKDYEGTNRFTPEEMENILDAALSTQEEIEKQGAKFAIIVVPNKENIYSEFMPDTYLHAEESSTDILMRYLADNGVHAISPKDELLENKSSMQLYYSYDTHWNQLGAYLGVKSILDSWDVHLPELQQRTIIESNLKDCYHYNGEDDLAKMVGLRFILNDEIEYEIADTGLMDWKMFEEEQANGKMSHFTNDDAEIQAGILLVGDSFRSSMVPALREVYRDVYVIHIASYDASMLDEINPDYVIAEYVERFSRDISNIDTLIK